MRRIAGAAVTVLVYLGLLTSDARAQRAPDMATLDRGDGITKLGIDLGLTFLEFPPYDAALRLEVYGQFVTRSGLGVYGALPMAGSFGAASEAEDPEPPDLLPNNANALGSADLGLLYVLTSSRRLSFVFRGGLVVPTASNGRDEAATLHYATFPRLTDLAMASDAWHVRLGLSPLIHVDRLFLRADVGFDLGFDDGRDLFRFNVGGGVDLGPVAVGVELANIADFDDLGDEDYLHSLALTLRFMGRSLQPFLSVGAPLDDSQRDAVDLFIAGGIQVLP